MSPSDAKRFDGFPASFQGTAIPNLFFSALLPQIDDAAEIKASLYLFREYYAKKGQPRYVRLSELAALPGLKSLGSEKLHAALDNALARGTFISLNISENDGADTIYLLNTAANRRDIARIAAGEITIPGTAPLPEEIADAPAENIFSLYENNIGELTPIVAEQLANAEKEYPADWLADAIREAADLNKRNWRYIQRILETWQAEGRQRGKSGRRVQGTEPGKYTAGRYGHMVRH